MWPLPKFERLHIGGWGIKFYKQHCYMFQVTHKVKQKKRLATSSVKNNRTHTSEAANFWLQLDPFLSNPKWARLRGHPASVVELAEHICVCFWSLCHTCSCKINIRGGSGQSIHPIPFALSVLIDTTSLALKDHKVLVHSTSTRVTNASLISSR